MRKNAAASLIPQDSFTALPSSALLSFFSCHAGYHREARFPAQVKPMKPIAHPNSRQTHCLIPIRKAAEPEPGGVVD
jgi:hypothetical protein